MPSVCMHIDTTCVQYLLQALASFPLSFLFSPSSCTLPKMTLNKRKNSDASSKPRKRATNKISAFRRSTEQPGTSERSKTTKSRMVFMNAKSKDKRAFNTSILTGQQVDAHPSADNGGGELQSGSGDRDDTSKPVVVSKKAQKAKRRERVHKNKV